MSNSKRQKFKLNSTGKNAKGKPTGFYRTVQISVAPKLGQKPGKLEVMSYDPRAVHPETGKRGYHVLFKQGKLEK